MSANTCPFWSDMLGTQQCVVNPSHCDRDGRMLSGIVGYGPQMMYAALATRTTFYLPGRRRVVSGVRAINSQYAFHVEPQHHPTWAGVLDGVGYGVFVTEIKDGFLSGCTIDVMTSKQVIQNKDCFFFQNTFGVLDLNHMEQVQIIGDDFCKCLRAGKMTMPPNVQRVGNGFLHGAKLQSTVDLSSLRLLTQCADLFCANLEAPGFIPPPNIETVGSHFLTQAAILSPVIFSSLPLLRSCSHSFCSHLDAPSFVPPPNIREVGPWFLHRARIRSFVNLSSMHVLRECPDQFCACLEAHAFLPPPNVEKVGHSFLFKAKIQSAVDLSSMQLLQSNMGYFCRGLKTFIPPPKMCLLEA